MEILTGVFLAVLIFMIIMLGLHIDMVLKLKKAMRLLERSGYGKEIEKRR
jgi:hypothetical protein